MLTVGDVAEHFGLRADTVRDMIRRGDLHAIRIHRSYRLAWPDVWACERGPRPRARQHARYQAPLMSKRRLAQAMSVSVRSVERWIAGGLPTRGVLGSVRVNPFDAEDWLRTWVGVELPADWWRR